MVERVLRQDEEGFYIKYKGMELPVRTEDGKDYLSIATQMREPDTNPAPKADKPDEMLQAQTSEHSNGSGSQMNSKVYPFEKFTQRSLRREATKPLVNKIRHAYNLSGKQAQNLAEYFVGGIPP